MSDNGNLKENLNDKNRNYNIESNTDTNKDTNSSLANSEKIHNPRKVALSKKSRYLLFSLLMITSLFVNIDHGAIPAATDNIKNDNNLTDTQLGTLGSLVYLGTAAGALFLSFVYNIINRKYILMVGFLLSGVWVYSFTVWKNYLFLSINRFLTGFFQSLVSVYLPIWIDQYSPDSTSTILMSLFQLSSPIGLILGYIITVIFIGNFKDISVKF